MSIGPLYLNLGCGGQIRDGWLNVDRAFLDEHEGFAADRLCLDLTKTWKWPWEEATVDGIVLHHVLDLLDMLSVWNLLNECAHILKLGAVLRISGADIEKCVARAMRDDWSWCAERRFGSPGTAKEASLGHFILQGGARKSYLPPPRLETMLVKCGFAHAYAVDFNRTFGVAKMSELDSRPDESFYLEAIR